MTREERIEWLKNATNEEVVNQLRWAVAGIYSDMIELQARWNEDYELITAELLKRMK